VLALTRDYNPLFVAALLQHVYHTLYCKLHFHQIQLLLLDRRFPSPIFNPLLTFLIIPRGPAAPRRILLFDSHLLTPRPRHLHKTSCELHLMEQITDAYPYCRLEFRTPRTERCGIDLTVVTL